MSSGKETAPPEAALAQSLLEEKEHEPRLRSYSGPMGRVISVLAALWSLWQIWATLGGRLDAMTLRSWHIIFLFTFAFLLYPAYRRQRRQRRFPGITDALLIGLSIAAFGYMIRYYTEITLRGGYFLPQDHLIASIAVLVSFEAARRAAGNLAWLALIFFLYNFVGQYIPGPFGTSVFSWNRVVEHLFWGSQGLLGTGVGVSATYIFMFVLFGAFLKASGFSGFINDFALALVGRTAGGPAKVAVIASALMGMINGSAVANVATVGTITIPLMKRTGYRAEFAAAVEAVASTGGQFTPPVMGAVGFIMAEILGVPYTKVMLAAAIPAFLYYLTLIVAVHFEARKNGLKGLSPENIPAAGKLLLKRGHLSLPLIALLVFMAMGYTPLYAAVFAIVAAVASSWVTKDTRMGPKEIFRALEDGARGAVSVGVACVIIGVIIGTVSLTGLGVKFGYEVLKYVGEGQLFLAGFFVMLVSFILGTGVPGIAAYVIVAAVAVPVLIKMGAEPMAAHMFCLIHACLSNITPPVAMSSYVAAGIARANETRTSLIAMKLGLTGFLLPFFFLDNPLLLYSTGANAVDTIQALITASIGALALAAGLQGWLFREMAWPVRIILVVTGGLFLHANLFTDGIGAVLGIAAVLWQYHGGRNRRDRGLPA